jgi:solute carrier family 25 protein 34/35
MSTKHIPSLSIQTMITPDPNLYLRSASFASGALGACCAVTFSNPFEVIKTRLQLQGELVKRNQLFSKPYQNLPQALRLVYQHEGVKGLQRGLKAAYGYQLIMNGTRFGCYDVFKDSMIRHLGVTSPSGVFAASIGAGAVSGMIAAFLGSPFFMAKTRLQAYSPHLPIGTQHNYSGVFSALKAIYQENGLSGWLRRSMPAVVRTGVGTSVQLTSYDYVKKGILAKGYLEDGLYLHTLASLCSGILVCTAMNPFDVVTTRMFNQPIDPQTGKGKLYRNMIHCFSSILKTEGFRGIFKGYTALYFRMGPHTVLTFIFMEQFKNFFLPSSFH